MFSSFLRGDAAVAPVDPAALFLSILLAFLAGQVLAWVYMRTHQGLSYSRAFVISLVVMPVIVALVMWVMANNLVTAFGLMAVFAIVRFRNILKDTLDTTYVLGAIVVGMACGMQRFTTAVVSVLVVAAILLYVRLTSFGLRHRFDHLIQVRWVGAQFGHAQAVALLRAHALRLQVPDAGGGMPESRELTYRFLARDPQRLPELVTRLRELPGAQDVVCLPLLEESEV